MNSIAIIGCGPAGLSAAIALHDAGLEVCLFEQFDEPRPVGSGLMMQPTGLEILERFGLRENVEALGQRIDGMLGRVAPNGKVVLDIRYKVLKGHHNNDMYGVAIHRASLFHVLYEAVLKRNIPIITNTTIQDIIVKPSASLSSGLKVQLVNIEGQTLSNKFDLVVDASGSQSRLAAVQNHRVKPKRLPYGALWTTVDLDANNFDATILEQRYMAASVMIGILPCGRLSDNQNALATLFWSIRADQYASFKSKGLEAWKQDVEKQWPSVTSLMTGITNIDQLIHATYRHRTLSQPYAPGILFVGDAAHSTSPQLGQGANMALLDALAVSKAIATSDDFNTFAPLYARMRNNHVKLYQACSYLLTPFYQSDSRFLPALRDLMFEPVSKLPFADKLVSALGSGVLTNPTNRIDRLAKKTASL